MNQNIKLIGAGLTGSLLGIYLAKKGYLVDIYEQRSDMRTTEISAGRSINLALSARGLKALKEVGLNQLILSSAIPMHGRIIHGKDGSISFQPYGKTNDFAINSVSRKNLNIQLMNEAEKLGKDNLKIHFNKKCLRYDLKKNKIRIRDSKTKEKSEITHKGILIGTDGSSSNIRNQMVNLPRFNLHQYYLNHGYKELTIPPESDGSFQIGKNGLHIWPRKSFMLIALPNVDGSFTCTLFLPFEGEKSFKSLTSEEKVESFFSEEFSDVYNLIQNLTKDFFSNPTGNLVTIKCNPWYIKDRILLLGDAAHAIVPFYGQGINAGFEDCRILNGLIRKTESDWQNVFKEFNKLRKINTDAIADLAIDNFIEMRDKVAEQKFLMKKALEKILEKKFPNFLSTYSRVTFNDEIPYSEAQKQGQIQDKLLEEECYKVDTIEDINFEKLLEKIQKETS